MFRRFAAVVAVAFLGIVGLIAAEHKGKLVKIDSDKNTVTVKTDDGEKTVGYTSDTKFFAGKKEIDEKGKTRFFNKEFKEGKAPDVTVTTEKKGDKEVATEVKVSGGGKKKSDNKKDKQ